MKTKNETKKQVKFEVGMPVLIGRWCSKCNCWHEHGDGKIVSIRQEGHDGRSNRYVVAETHKVTRKEYLGGQLRIDHAAIERSSSLFFGRLADLISCIY